MFQVRARDPYLDVAGNVFNHAESSEGRSARAPQTARQKERKLVMDATGGLLLSDRKFSHPRRRRQRSRRNGARTVLVQLGEATVKLNQMNVAELTGTTYYALELIGLVRGANGAPKGAFSTPVINRFGQSVIAAVERCRKANVRPPAELLSLLQIATKPATKPTSMSTRRRRSASQDLERQASA